MLSSLKTVFPAGPLGPQTAVFRVLRADLVEGDETCGQFLRDVLIAAPKTAPKTGRHWKT